jgi:hypothetical protein
LTARGLNDFARRRLGTQSPTDKKTLLQLSCAAPKPPVVTEEDTALLELIGRALDLHHEPNEDSRFYGVAPKSATDSGEATTSQGQDDEEETAPVVEPMQRGRMWDSKRVAYFLALCCLAPANVYAFNPTFTENCLVRLCHCILCVVRLEFAADLLYPRFGTRRSGTSAGTSTQAGVGTTPDSGCLTNSTSGPIRTSSGRRLRLCLFESAPNQ